LRTAFLQGLRKDKPPSGYEVAQSHGGAMLKGDGVWLRRHGCHVAVVRPEVLAQLVSYKLVELWTLVKFPRLPAL
jgi:hypothetical protein